MDGVIARAEKMVREGRRIVGDDAHDEWQQTPDYEPEQWARSHGGRSVLVEDTTGMHPGEPPWTWSHYDVADPFEGAQYPSAWGRAHSLEDARAAADLALSHEGDPGHWSDMVEHGWDPQDQAPRRRTRR